MGTVWHAHDEVLDTEVALKEVQLGAGLSAAERATSVARAMREARNATRLRGHRHVVTLHDVVLDGELPWLVMELVPSRSLADFVAAEGPLPPHRAAAIGLELLDALTAAHALEVLHRDVKPSNVLLAEDGRSVLTDFGIAVHAADPTLTGTGALGSPGFLAPERLRGLPATTASDLYGLGATLYHAVEGRPPYVRDTLAAMLAAPLLDPPDPPRRAGSLAPVVSGLLVADPRERLDADAVRRLLAAAAGSPAPSATATSPAQPGRRSVHSTVPPLPPRPPAAPGTQPEPNPPTAPDVHLETTRTATPPAPNSPASRGARRRLLAIAGVLVVLGAAGAATALLLRGGGSGHTGKGGAVVFAVSVRPETSGSDLTALLARTRKLPGVLTLSPPRDLEAGPLMVCTEKDAAKKVEEHLRKEPAVRKVPLAEDSVPHC
jgi:eukaryotic-like serine/threonine-protein kinase